MSLQTSSAARPDSGAFALTPDEVHRLLSDHSSDARVDMTNKIGAVYNQAQLSVRENTIAEQIFRLLLRDTELRVRISLASYVKDSQTIPRDIVMSLARDVVEVALPVLQHSQVLTDEDLIELVESTQEISRYLAVSKRSSVSAAVTDALIAGGDANVAQTLIDNKGAEISVASLEKIIEDYKENDVLIQSLSDRPQLPITVVDKLLTVVSSTFAQTLKQKYKISTDHIEKEVEKTREKETLNLVRLTASDEDVGKLVTQLHAYGRLTPSIILNALCQGNFVFFETALAKLSNIPVANARKLITDRGELGFRAIYNKTGLPDGMFPAVKLLLRIVREVDGEGEKPGTTHYANRLVERILQQAEEDPVDNLSYIIALVRKVAA